LAFVVRLHRRAQRDLKKLKRGAPATHEKAIGWLKSLEIEPKPPDSEPLRGPLSRCRKIRIGDYRIVYEIDNSLVRVHRVGHRSEVYR